MSKKYLADVVVPEEQIMKWEEREKPEKCVDRAIEVSEITVWKASMLYCIAWNSPEALFKEIGSIRNSWKTLYHQSDIIIKNC